MPIATQVIEAAALTTLTNMSIRSSNESVGPVILLVDHSCFGVR